MSVANLIASRDALETYLAGMYTDPKPTYSVDGRSFSWDAHRASIMAELEAINDMILKRSGNVAVSTIVLT